MLKWRPPGRSLTPRTYCRRTLDTLTFSSLGTAKLGSYPTCLTPPPNLHQHRLRQVCGHWSQWAKFTPAGARVHFRSVSEASQSAKLWWFHFLRFPHRNRNNWKSCIFWFYHNMQCTVIVFCYVLYFTVKRDAKTAKTILQISHYIWNYNKQNAGIF